MKALFLLAAVVAPPALAQPCTQQIRALLEEPFPSAQADTLLKRAGAPSIEAVRMQDLYLYMTAKSIYSNATLSYGLALRVRDVLSVYCSQPAPIYTPILEQRSTYYSSISGMWREDVQIHARSQAFVIRVSVLALIDYLDRLDAEMAPYVREIGRLKACAGGTCPGQ